MLLAPILVIVIGILAGGLINILADDLPHDRLPHAPRYADGTLRPRGAWLGILAFATGKHIAPDGKRMRWRYPLTEIATAAGMVIALLVKNARTDVSDVQLIFWLIYVFIMVLVTVIDLEQRLILFSVMIPAYIIAILDAIFTPTQREPGVPESLIAGAVGFGVYYILYQGGNLYVHIQNQRGRNIDTPAFGFGDVMLSTLSGLILGPGALILAMFITVFAGAAGSVIYLITRLFSKEGYVPFTPLPYGQYIVLGLFLMLFFGSQMRYMIIGY